MSPCSLNSHLSSRLSIHAHTHKHTHSLSLSHTHTHSLRHTHTHTLSHTHTHTHTHTALRLTLEVYRSCGPSGVAVAMSCVAGVSSVHLDTFAFNTHSM